MGREGWIYALVFVAVLGAGGLLIAPRLLKLGEPPAPIEAPPLEPPALEEPEAPEVVVLDVRGPDGPLQAPLTHVEGGRVEWKTAWDDLHPRLEVLPEADHLLLRAPGHMALRLPTLGLMGEHTVVLAAAAPPLALLVREADGRAAQGIPVRVEPWSGGDEPTTDAEGRLVLDELSPGLVVLDVGGALRRGPTLRAVAGEDRTLEATLEPAWTVSGRVVDATGVPVAGAHVEGLRAGSTLGEAGFTDARGRFVWRGPVTSVLALRVLRPPSAARRLELRPPSRGPLNQDVGDIALDRSGGGIRGRVVAAGAGARPVVRVEPAVAAVLRELFLSEAVLDVAREPEVAPDGTFRIEGLPAQLPLRVSVRGAGQPLDRRVELRADDILDLELLPPAGVSLWGRVVALDGKGVPGLELILSRAPGSGRTVLPGEQSLRTLEDGTFRLDGLTPGSVFLRGYPEAARTVLERVRLPLTKPLTIGIAALPRSERTVLTGMVVDEGNIPLEGVVVRGAGRVSTTDAEGRFRLEGVEVFEGDVRVVARFEPGSTTALDSRPFAGGIVRRVEIGVEPLHLVLPRSRTVRFRVLDGIDDEPISFLHVVARTDAGEVLADRPVAPIDGEVRLAGMPTKGFTLSLFSHRHRLVHVVPMRVHADPGRNRDLGDLRLMHGMRIEGRVVDEEGQPVPYARLGGLEAGWSRTRTPDPTLRRELALRRTQADADGRFLFEGFDPKRQAMIAVWASGFAPSSQRVVLERFRENVRVEAQFTLRRGGFLSIELVDAGTRGPISGAVFDLEDGRSGSDYLDVLRRGMLGAAVASEDAWRHASAHLLFEQREGAYRIGPITPGPHEVWAHRPGYETLRRRLTVLDAVTEKIVGPISTHRIGDMLKQTWAMQPLK